MSNNGFMTIIDLSNLEMEMKFWMESARTLARTVTKAVSIA